MIIQELFARPINRTINGVIKADQLDDHSVWQELDEFVVTKELTKHLNELVSVFINALEEEEDAADKNGIWISGYFGSGKSHFLKILAYLLANARHQKGDDSKTALEFFSDKITDAMLFADLTKVVATQTSTILFNIDTKADLKEGRDALLQVFLKVLNEQQGFSGSHPHIANLERYLDGRGELAQFHAAYEKHAGSSWLEDRDAWEFHADELQIALQEVLQQSESSVQRWLDGGEENFGVSIENFAGWVLDYLNQRGPDHRMIFLVDEVGQFIGGETQLMLNLQTIVEALGTVCRGRAWVAVTAQEDLDKVLEVKQAGRNDFSKIQGRFKTRLSFSSSNVDEVIKTRLLQKNEEARTTLASTYDGKEDLLRHQLSFWNAGMTFKGYGGLEDFQACYPFAAYQFQLVQKVFESIRLVGASGLHISQGERSTLNAFQDAAKKIMADAPGRLVPFYRFYPSVEVFLEGVVWRTIDQARTNSRLEDFDVALLQVLFLIRYIDEMPGNVHNLTTLCIDEMDADRLALSKKIEASLARLESETLVARNGEIYFFLTNEERDIGREIKNHSISPNAEEIELGKILFEDVLKDARKHTYSETQRSFPFSRLCDDFVIGTRIEGNLEVAVYSPLSERYPDLREADCILQTSGETARVMAVLPDDHTLGRELRTYVQTESYLKTKHTATLASTTNKILKDRHAENRERRQRIVADLKERMNDAQFYSGGQKLQVRGKNPSETLSQALEYVIKNSFSKMGYIKHLSHNPKGRLQSLLRANDLDQVTLELDNPESNPRALDEVREYIQLASLSNQQIVLNELLEQRFGQRPYGWLEEETVLVVARLAVLKEITLESGAKVLKPEDAYDHLITPNKQRKVVIKARKVADKAVLQEARSLSQKLFGQKGPDGEEALYEFLQKELKGWSVNLDSYAAWAKTGKYPGKADIEDCQKGLPRLVQESESATFLQYFTAQKSDLLDLEESYGDLHGFYSTQRTAWDQLLETIDRLGHNRAQLEPLPEAGPALQRLEEIAAAPAPYDLLREVAALQTEADRVNEELMGTARNQALAGIQKLLDQLDRELDRTEASTTLRQQARARLEERIAELPQAASIAHLSQDEQLADADFSHGMTEIERAVAPPLPEPDTPEESPPAPGAEPLPVPKLKPRKTVDPRAVWTGGFLETPEDVEKYLTQLRAQLESALADGQRVQLK